MRVSRISLAAAMLLGASHASAQAFNGPSMIGTCSGQVGTITDQQASCGVSGANGVVTTSGLAGSTQYGWISTRNGSTSSSVYLPGVTSPGGRLGPNSPTNGTTWTYSFWAAAGDVLSFRFNYITSDGLGWEDYGYAQLNDELLFTARSSPAAPAVPGAGMPVAGLYSGAPVGSIKANQTTWAALGDWSNTCWDAGCGFTGWLSMQYVVTTAGQQNLKFGVVNLNDQLWDTGMAFDFDLVTSTGTPPAPTELPLFKPASGCAETEYETEDGGGKQKGKDGGSGGSTTDGTTVTTVKIKEGSCADDDLLQFDDSYTGQLAVASQEIPAVPAQTTVPEPSTVILAGIGLLVVAAVKRKR